jgi:methanogenic corrinoid protein MtbC1
MTGVAAATLRAWERRYGLPRPRRTSAAYRLYDDRDVAAIRRMREMMDDGVSASEAARTIASEEQAPDPGASRDDEADAFALAAGRIVAAAVAFDVDALEAEVARALAIGSAVDVFERALRPAMQEIGDKWHAGEITVAQEHVASQTVGSAVSQLLRLVQPSGATKTALLACFAEEDHAIGLLGVGLRLASWGFRSVVIGPRTPPSAVSRAIDALAPDVVALSVTIEPSASRARELVDAYADACQTTPWLVGGEASKTVRAFVEARGGIVVGQTLDERIRRELERALAHHRGKRPAKRPKK